MCQSGPPSSFMPFVSFALSSLRVSAHRLSAQSISPSVAGGTSGLCGDALHGRHHYSDLYCDTAQPIRIFRAKTMRLPSMIGQTVLFGAGIALGFLIAYVMLVTGAVIDASLVLSCFAVLLAGISFAFTVYRYFEDRKLERPLFSLYDKSVKPPPEFSAASDVIIEMVFHFRNIGKRSAQEIWIRSVRVHGWVDTDETSVANRIDANGTVSKIVDIPAYVVDGEVFAGRFEQEKTARTKEVSIYISVAYADARTGDHHCDEFWVYYHTDNDFLINGTFEHKNRLQAYVARQGWSCES